MAKSGSLFVCYQRISRKARGSRRPETIPELSRIARIICHEKVILIYFWRQSGYYTVRRTGYFLISPLFPPRYPVLFFYAQNWPRSGAVGALLIPLNRRGGFFDRIYTDLFTTKPALAEAENSKTGRFWAGIILFGCRLDLVVFSDYDLLNILFRIAVSKRGSAVLKGNPGNSKPHCKPLSVEKMDLYD